MPYVTLIVGGAVASWLLRSVRVRDLAEDNALCSRARHLMGEFNAGGTPAMD